MVDLSAIMLNTLPSVSFHHGKPPELGMLGMTQWFGVVAGAEPHHWGLGSVRTNPPCLRQKWLDITLPIGFIIRRVVC